MANEQDKSLKGNMSVGDIGPSTAQPLPPTNVSPYGGVSQFITEDTQTSTPTAEQDVSPEDGIQLDLEDTGEAKEGIPFELDESTNIMKSLDLSPPESGDDDYSIQELELDTDEESTKEENTSEQIKLTIPLSQIKATNRALRETAESYQTEAALLKDAADSDTKLGILREAIRWYSPQQKLMHQALRKLQKSRSDNDIPSILTNRIKGIGEGIPKRLIKKETTTELSGQEAALHITADMQGVLLLPLINSGFFITVRPLRIPEIVSFFNTANLESYNYGREMGGWFFVFSDLKIKQLIIRTLLPGIIKSSNYKNYREVNKLLKNISIQDYDTILWGMACLMYRQGVPVRYICTYENCRHVEEAMIDLTKLRLYNRDLITEPIRKFMNREIIRNDKDLRDYRENILPFKEEFKFTVNNPATGLSTNWKLDLKVPTMLEYFQRGEEFNTDILNAIDSDAPAQAKEEVSQQIVYNFYKMFIPWIDKITRLDDEGNMVWYCSNSLDVDIKAFREILEVQQMEETKLGDFITGYTQRTKLTHIAYRYPECPACHRVPDTSVQGFIPYDVQSAFFSICLSRLKQVYSDLGR